MQIIQFLKSLIIFFLLYVHYDITFMRGTNQKRWLVLN